MQDEVKVSQADREAALPILCHLYVKKGEEPALFIAEVKAGKYDDHYQIKAFARHRHQAERETLARMEWRPIETAPKDGTRILVYSTTEPPHYDDQQYIETICDGHHVKEVQPARWISEDDMWELMYIGSPLFWMPLPPAPEAGQ